MARFGKLAMFAAALVPSSAMALPLTEPAPRYHWECVPFARAVSGVQIFGDARTWWDQAEGRYARGNRPKVGAVMAFIPRGRMVLGHVATVSEIVDDRTLLITHANWSPIGGRRGQVERDVAVIDVSADNDWSVVRVWYGPNAALGGTAWPVHGFIYPARAPEIVAPKLQYASVLGWWPKARHIELRIRPTGQLAYLGAELRKLK